MINVEIKARATEAQQLKCIDWLDTFVKGPDGESMTFKGADRQIDTYFKVPNGRLKLREGNIENCLIQYERPNQAGPKVSKYNLVYVREGNIKDALTKALGVLAIVDKTRLIYFLGNVKIHFDTVLGLGRFIEIEARDEEENLGLRKLTAQTNHLMGVFSIKSEDLITDSYSDMILNGGK